MLQNWTKSEEEKCSRSQLLQFFQIALTSEELTLSIAVMLTLWCLNSPANASTSQSRPANLIRLAYFLRKFNDIEESYSFLLQLLWSFWHAVTSIDKERSVSIIQFLRSVAEVDESSSSSMNEGLDDYFETRVLAKSHEDAEQVSDAVLDELSDEFSCLKESSEA